MEIFFSSGSEAEAQAVAETCRQSRCRNVKVVLDWGFFYVVGDYP